MRRRARGCYEKTTRMSAMAYQSAAQGRRGRLGNITHLCFYEATGLIGIQSLEFEYSCQPGDVEKPGEGKECRRS